MTSFIESMLYYSVKIFGAFVRLLPADIALALGRAAGKVVYSVDGRHREQVFLNLKIAFSGTKSIDEIQALSKSVFENYGQNVIELLRLPLMTKENFPDYVAIEGQEHITEALKQNRGVILLAMHYGSWELASLAGAMLGPSYKVIVNPQSRFSRLDDLLNKYRSCGGNVVIEKGVGTRDIIRSLQKNDIVAMVVDQGGKGGSLLPFFGRQASFSVGAVRLALKMGTPICFVVIQRQAGKKPRHRLMIHEPLAVTSTGQTEDDVRLSLVPVAQRMEMYIRQQPAEYMWFYKIWKYSREVVILLLNDGRTGHLRQSQAVVYQLEPLLKARGLTVQTKTIDVVYKSPEAATWFAALAVVVNDFIGQGRIALFKKFLTPSSCEQLLSVKADFIVSCGSANAPVNFLLAAEQQAKNVTVLKPGIFSYKRFDLSILPAHDQTTKPLPGPVIYTQGAPNLITPEYLDEHAQALLKHFSHLKITDRLRIGILLGGDTKSFVLNEKKVRMVIHQIQEVAADINAEILLTTSRRTSRGVENFLSRELKKDPRCRLLILANRNNVPEAVGGILGLSDIVVVSGDSISMISEAASSGKKTLVFPVQSRLLVPPLEQKHNRFIDILHQEGYIYATDPRQLHQAVYNIFKNKIQLRKLNDGDAIKNGLSQVI